MKKDIKIGVNRISSDFRERWVQHSRSIGIDLVDINCHGNEIIQKAKHLDGILWHWLHYRYEDQLTARQTITAIEMTGCKVYPNSKTCWHYDDKIAQKYLLESVDAPIIPTWVFTSKCECLKWVDGTNWPKVFKLRCGAGSRNVRLIKSKAEANSLISRCFDKGFQSAPTFLNDASTKIRKIKSTSDLLKRIKNIHHTVANFLRMRKYLPKQIGYAYFQEYLPGNSFDTRITIIGGRAFGYIRKNRPDDFRASGSGNNIYDPRQIDTRCVQIAFQVARQLGVQSLAFDFLFNEMREPMISEISYCFVPDYVHNCPGYWDSNCNWITGAVWPEHAILDDFLDAILLEKQSKIKSD
jgi:glutathione synthase/RimK-type ligase-like ATP-grasp enzyme